MNLQSVSDLLGQLSAKQQAIADYIQVNLPKAREAASCRWPKCYTVHYRNRSAEPLTTTPPFG